MRFLKNSKGFTLVEVAIVLVIVGLLLAGGINLMSASADTARYKESQNQMSEIKEALVTYYTQYKQLPCPDTDNDPANIATYGVENRAGSTCTTNWGWLPHATLGIGGGRDAWGERIKYVINGAFSAPATATNFCTTSTIPYSRDVSKTATQIIIQDTQATAATLGDWAAFALVATGRNGRQTNAGNNPPAFTNTTACGTLNTLEQENCDNDSTLRFGNQMTDGGSVTFDDMVVWVGDMQLISELRKSGLCSTANNNNGNNGGNNNNNNGNNNGSGGSAADPNNRTTADLTPNLLQQTLGDYNALPPILTSNTEDKLRINGNMNKDLNLKNGDNTLDVKGNGNGVVTAGTGNDTVRVQGNLNKAADLGDGNDVLEVWGNANATVNMGAGDDSVRIEGDINQNVSLGVGSNAIYVSGNVNADITANTGSAIVYLDNYATLASVPSALKGDSDLTLKCKNNGAWVTCS